MLDTTSTDDPFEEFEVESGSEKEFLIANLKYDAPQEDVEQFREARNPPAVNYSRIVQQWNTTMNQRDFEETVCTARVSDIYFRGQDWQEFKFLQNATAAEIDARIYELILCGQDENGQTPLPSLEYPAPHLVLQHKVEEFARSHMFYVNRHTKPTTLQRREFTRDIYDYARAIGMGRNQANAEVLRAKASYRRDRGLPGGLKLDESDDESSLGLEINDAAEYIASMINGMQRGPVDPAGAWDEITRLEAKISNSNHRDRKRKHESLDHHAVNGDLIIAGRLGDAGSSRPSKKQKRRKVRQRHSNGSNQRPNQLADMAAISKRKKRLKRAMKRKRAMLGKPEVGIDVKSEEKSPIETTYKHTSMAYSGSEHIRKASGRMSYNQAVSAEKGKVEEVVPTEKLNHKDLTCNNNGIHNNAGSDSWNLRKKKKKKRKRRPASGPSNNPGCFDAKIKAEPDGKMTNINSIQIDKAPLNMDHSQSKSEMTTGYDKEAVNQDTTYDSGEALPLSELMSANSTKGIRGRRDRGKGKKTVASSPKLPKSAAVEAGKDYHS